MSRNLLQDIIRDIPPFPHQYQLAFSQQRLEPSYADRDVKFACAKTHHFRACSTLFSLKRRRFYICRSRCRNNSFSVLCLRVPRIGPQPKLEQANMCLKRYGSR